VSRAGLHQSLPTGCLHFGSKDDMKDLAEKRATQLREHTSHKNDGAYDPQGVGGPRTGTGRKLPYEPSGSRCGGSGAYPPEACCSGSGRWRC